VEEIQHGINGCNTYLLDLFSKKKLKFRDLDGRIDLFFSDQDLFIFLNEQESTLFRKIFIKNDLDLSNQQETSFLEQLYNEQKR
jgi:hypothetical protein